MKLPSYVKPFPKFLNFLGAKGYKPAITKNIYLREDIYRDLLKEKPNHISISLLIHEEEHKKKMNLSSGLMYLLFPKSRLEEELNAYRVQFGYLKKHNETSDLERIARKLSGPLYLFATNYKNAKRLLDKAWEEA